MNKQQIEKIDALRDIILDRADGQKRVLLKDTKAQADAWVAQESEKLEMEANLIIQDAKKRADEVRRRQVLAAEKERSAEVLRLQNRLLSDALNMLQDELIALRERPDYQEILAGLCAEALRAAGDELEYFMSLSAADAALGEPVAALVCKLGFKVSFDAQFAPIPGGVWIVSKGGHRRVNADWRQKTSELADVVAERLIPLL